LIEDSQAQVKPIKPANWTMLFLPLNVSFIFLFEHHYDYPGSGSVFLILMRIQGILFNTVPDGSGSETLDETEPPTLFLRPRFNQNKCKTRQKMHHVYIIPFFLKATIVGTKRTKAVTTGSITEASASSREGRVAEARPQPHPQSSYNERRHRRTRE